MAEPLTTLFRPVGQAELDLKLEGFNRHIRGPIEVIAEFHALRTD